MSIKFNVSRLAYGITAAAVITGSLASSDALAAEKVRWQVPLAFPSHLIGLTTPVKHLSENLKAVSGGDIQLRYYEPGELIPPFEIMDAVGSGKHVGVGAEQSLVTCVVSRNGPGSPVGKTSSSSPT